MYFNGVVSKKNPKLRVKSKKCKKKKHKNKKKQNTRNKIDENGKAMRKQKHEKTYNFLIN